MSSIGALLKQEITRLARKEVRAQTEATRKATNQHRGSIASLKKQVAELERALARLQRQQSRGRPAPAAADQGEERIRFVPKGLKSHRERLGLSAAEYGLLAGVSSQSIYNWERGQASPRAGQLKALASLRGLGKREALRRLEAAAAQPAAKPKKG